MNRKGIVLGRGRSILKTFYIKYTILRVLRRIVGRKKFVDVNIDIYEILQNVLYFYSNLRTYCLISGNARSTTFGFISRHKLKEYAGIGAIVGVKKTTM